MQRAPSTMSASAFCKKFVPPEVYPLLVPLAFACGLGGYMSYRTLSGAPDIHLFGKQPRYETGAHRVDPHFAGIHSKASRFDPHPDMGQAEAEFNSKYSTTSH